MCYKCEVCGQVQRGPKCRYAVLRDDGSIEREVPVCNECLEDLCVGVPLDTLKEDMKPYYGKEDPPAHHHLPTPECYW